MSNTMSRPTDYRSENDARQAIIDACLTMNELGINQGKAGNVSVRWHRGAADGYLITPSAVPYQRMRPADIVWLGLNVDNDAAAESLARAAAPGLRPSSEWRMHQMIYRQVAVPYAAAVVHTHSSFATSLACLPAIQSAGIPAFHYMIAIAGGNDIRCARYETFGTQALSDSAWQALQQRRACLLANHGQLAYGASLAQALELAAEVETLCRMFWQALQLGTPTILDGAEMARVLDLFEHYQSPALRSNDKNSN
jgi:L-fuculose-phosphate aldolase